MAVIIETSLGDLEIDLFTDEWPNTWLNFLKLAKWKYYNNLRFFEIHRNFLTRSGDPSHKGRGGWSIFGLQEAYENLEVKPKFLSDIPYDKQLASTKRFFEDEIHPTLKHNQKGLLCTSNKGPNMNESSFYITLTEEHADYLDGKHTIFGRVAEGMDVLDSINSALLMTKEGLDMVDKGEPYQAIRIKHVLVIDDPFDDPVGLQEPSRSPSPVKNLDEDEQAGFVEDNIDLKNILSITEGDSEGDVEKYTQKKIAKSRAHVLEILGDLPEADIEPPKNVLFVCQLNPVTQESDLESIFWRFGEIKSCNVVRDWKTGDSLQYAFIEFESEEAWVNAYLKMNNVNIDERRIKVDFSQSVAKLWAPYKKKQFQEAAKELFKEYEIKKDTQQEGENDEDRGDRHSRDRKHKKDSHRDRDDRHRDDRYRDERHRRSDKHKSHRRDDSRDRHHKKQKRNERSNSDERRDHKKNKRSHE